MCNTLLLLPSVEDTSNLLSNESTKYRFRLEKSTAIETIFVGCWLRITVSVPSVESPERDMFRGRRSERLLFIATSKENRE